MEQREIQLLSDINDKLSTILALLAIQGKSKEDQIRILSSLEFSNSKISILTATPKGTVDGIRAKFSK